MIEKWPHYMWGLFGLTYLLQYNKWNLYCTANSDNKKLWSEWCDLLTVKGNALLLTHEIKSRRLMRLSYLLSIWARSITDIKWVGLHCKFPCCRFSDKVDWGFNFRDVVFYPKFISFAWLAWTIWCMHKRHVAMSLKFTMLVSSYGIYQP